VFVCVCVCVRLRVYACVHVKRVCVYACVCVRASLRACAPYAPGVCIRLNTIHSTQYKVTNIIRKVDLRACVCTDVIEHVDHKDCE